MSESMISGLSQTTDRMRMSGKADEKMQDAQQGMFATLFGQMTVQTSSGTKSSQMAVKKQPQTVKVQQTKSGVQLKQTQNPSGTLTAEQVQKATQTFTEKANQIIKDEFGVTEEEIADAMEKLGLTYESLIQPVNFVQLAAELTGSGEVSSLLVNGDFTQTMTQWQELTGQLQEELGLTQEDLQQLADEMQKQQLADETQVVGQAEETPQTTSMENEVSKTDQTKELAAQSDGEIDHTQMQKSQEQSTPQQTVTTAQEPESKNRGLTEQPEQTRVSEHMSEETNLPETTEAVVQKEVTDGQKTVPGLQNEEILVTEQVETASEDATETVQTVETSKEASKEALEKTKTDTETTKTESLQQATDTETVEQPQQTQTQSQSQSDSDTQEQQEQKEMPGQSPNMESQSTVENENVEIQTTQNSLQTEKTVHGKHDTAAHMTQGIQTQQTMATQQNGEVSQAAPQQQIDTQAIIEQVTKFAKTHISLDGTTISMQLNPEHLGKLYLQASYKNGVLTAQLAAQDSAVKDAIEHQISRLQESLNQQGIKVEAIEVTVASHEFEQNLEGNQQQLSQDMGQQQQQERQQNRRNLNLNEENIQALFEDLSEDDSLKAKMMLENGNSVDMTA